MSITYISDIEKVKKDEINMLYGNARNYYFLFKNSYRKVFALSEEKLIGAIRVISDGYETALLVDLMVDSDYEHSIVREQIKLRLVFEIEKELSDRRVMVYSDRANLEVYEAAGYGRCKNAWTYFSGQMDEKDFLPAGYRYENEFLADNSSPISEKKRHMDACITIKDGYEDATDEAVNELLTKAFFGRPHDVSKTKAVFANSQYVVSAFDGEKLVGVARAVSDGGKYATILNVAVDPDYQGMSIGKRVVLYLSEQISEEIIVLNTHPGAVGFYNRLKEFRRNKYVFEKNISSNTKNKLSPERMGAMFTPAGYRFPDEY